MFTIKHIDQYGGEFAIEATSYSVVREHVDGKKSLVRLLAYDTPYRTDDYIGLWVGVEAKDSLPTNSIFIMNRHGSTIAHVSYDEMPDDYWAQVAAEPVLAQADPEALAA